MLIKIDDLWINPEAVSAVTNAVGHDGKVSPDYAHIYIVDMEDAGFRVSVSVADVVTRINEACEKNQ